jgi:hypothetical protein
MKFCWLNSLSRKEGDGSSGTEGGFQERARQGEGFAPNPGGGSCINQGEVTSHVAAHRIG